jgi:DNA polymerase-3 subunit delta'
MSFDYIRDQEVPIRLLQNMLRTGRLANGLMFWGPGGVGKRLVAMEMAKAVNCRENRDNPCDHCLSCRKVANGNHPDVKTVVPVKKSRIIDVETVDSINELASLRPFESEWRIFIIHDADRMNLPAQNHFLKTLEEPPGRSMFLLLTEFPRMLLPTIRSRCQMVRFRPLSPATTVDLLREQRDLPQELAESVAALSQGQMSRAFDLLDTEKREIVLSVVERLAEGADPLLTAEEFSRSLDARRKQIEASLVAESKDSSNEPASPEDRERNKAEMSALVDALCRRDIMEYLYLFETWYRDELVQAATGGVGSLLNRDRQARLRELAGTGDPEKKILAIEKARRYLDKFINEERVFRDLFFSLAR